MISVIVVAALPSVRAGLRALLAAEPEVEVVAAGAGVDGAEPAGVAVDVAVIDLDGGQGDLPARVAARYPNAAHVLLVDGPDGYRPPSGAAAGRPWAALLKDAGADELAAAVRAVSRGLVVLDPAVAARLTESGAAFAREGDPLDEPLTEREAEVLHLVALGLPNKTIAQRLGISEHTAKFHVGSILAKLGAASRTEAVALAARRGVLVL